MRLLPLTRPTISNRVGRRLPGEGGRCVSTLRSGNHLLFEEADVGISDCCDCSVCVLVLGFTAVSLLMFSWVVRSMRGFVGDKAGAGVFIFFKTRVSLLADIIDVEGEQSLIFWSALVASFFSALGGFNSTG